MSFTDLRDSVSANELKEASISLGDISMIENRKRMNYISNKSKSNPDEMNIICINTGSNLSNNYNTNTTINALNATKMNNSVSKKEINWNKFQDRSRVISPPSYRNMSYIDNTNSMNLNNNPNNLTYANINNNRRPLKGDEEYITTIDSFVDNNNEWLSADINSSNTNTNIINNINTNSNNSNIDPLIKSNDYKLSKESII